MTAPADTTGRRFLRFVLVGIVNTGFGYAAYALLVLAGLGPQAALALAFALGVVWNYATSARFVFRVGGWGPLPAYALSYLALYGLNALALRGLLAAGLAPLAAQAILVPAMAVASFAVLSRVMRPRAGSRPRS